MPTSARGALQGAEAAGDRRSPLRFLISGKASARTEGPPSGRLFYRMLYVPRTMMVTAVEAFTPRPSMVIM